MQTLLRRVLVVSMGIACVVPLLAQQTREEAVNGMRKVLPSEMDAAYTHPAPFARELVNRALERHPEVLLMAIHAQPPGHGNVIVASNFGRIGKRGDEDDMRCIHTGKSNLEVNGPHFEDELALRDASGRIVGALGVVFNYKPGDDKERLIRIADAIGREMQRQLPNAERLIGPRSK